MTRLLGRTLALAFGLTLLSIVAGCAEEKPTKPKLQARDTLGKTTQDVRELKAELAKGGVVTDGKTHSTDYLDLQADIYRTKVAEIGQLRVKQDIGIYEALNDGEKPMSYEVFMEQIIKKGKAEGIQLAVLPYYQEYAYDADKKELVVVEYPAKKKAMQDQTDREMHRK
jgi:hypothetical protein